MPSFPSFLIPKQLGSPVGLLRSKLSIQGLKFKPLPLQNWAMANVYQYNEEVGEARRPQLETMQEMGNMFEIKRSATYNNLVYIQTAISEPHGKCKPENYKRYTHKREKTTQTTIKMVMKPQEKSREEK